MKKRNPRTGLGTWAWITDTLLFLSSYTIMFAALALRFESPRWLQIACWLLAGIGLAWALWTLGLQRLLTKDWITITSVDDRGPDVGGYLATYLLPLIVIASPTTGDLLAYLLIFGAMGLVYVRSRLVQINPTFYLFGYRLFYVQTEDGFVGYLLSMREPRAGEQIRVVQRDRLLLDLRLWFESAESAA